MEGSGTLYVVATPIGNLADLSARAVSVLGQAALVAAEDTRHTRKLLSHAGIQAEMVSYREQNHARAAQAILATLAQGGDVALVSDAGTPGVSDPGSLLVQQALGQGVRVVPVPGPSAVIAALSASGLASDAFSFVGFLPRKPGARQELLLRLAPVPATLIFYESPRRVLATLADLEKVLGDRQAVVARELTKIHETFVRGRLHELPGLLGGEPRGECTLLVAGPEEEQRAALDEGWWELASALRDGVRLPTKELARLLGSLSGAGSRFFYEWLIGRAPSVGPDQDA